MRLRKSEKGSITVEAALAIPVFFSAVLTIAFFTRIVYTHSLVQHALVDTANQFAVYEYVDKNKRLEGKGEIAARLLEPAFISNIEKQAGNGEAQLKKLMVVDGKDGLNFIGSNLLDKDGNVDLRVSYSVRPLVTIKMIPDITLYQRAVVKAWTDEKEEKKEEKADNIWELPSMTRGKEIQTKLGRNLPDKFPVVAKQEGSTITSIKSINLNDVTYRKPTNLKNTVQGYLKDIVEFSEGKYKDKTINKGDYNKKELIIVIPKESTTKETKEVLDNIVKMGLQKGVSVSIKEI